MARRMKAEDGNSPFLPLTVIAHNPRRAVLRFHPVPSALLTRNMRNPAGRTGRRWTATPEPDMLRVGDAIVWWTAPCGRAT